MPAGLAETVCARGQRAAICVRAPGAARSSARRTAGSRSRRSRPGHGRPSAARRPFGAHGPRGMRSGSSAVCRARASSRRGCRVHWRRSRVSACRPRGALIPTIANPPSPWKHVTGKTAWVTYGSTDQRGRDKRHWKVLNRYGLKDVVICDHEICMRDGGESFTSRRQATADGRQRRKARGLPLRCARRTSTDIATTTPVRTRPCTLTHAARPLRKSGCAVRAWRSCDGSPMASWSSSLSVGRLNFGAMSLRSWHEGRMTRIWARRDSFGQTTALSRFSRFRMRSAIGSFALQMMVWPVHR